MAILKKRRSQASLPEATSDKGVIISRPGDKLTSTVTNRPDRPAGDLGTTRPALTSRKAVGTAPGTPAGRLTSAIKGEAVSTPKIGGGTTTAPAKTATQKAAGPAKPALTSVVGAPKTITNKVSGATRPSVSTSQNKPGSTSGLTNAITGALTGAAIGVGTKAVYDKLTGTKKIVDASKVPGGTTNKPGGSTPKPGGTTNLPGGTTNKPGGTTNKPGGTTTKPGGTTTKPGGTTTKPGGTTGGPTKPTTGGPKAPVTPKGPTKPGGTTGGTKPGSGASGFPVGVSPNAKDNGDGTYTETYDDGSTMTVDADGNVIGTTDAEGTDIVSNEDGTTTYTYDDGSTVTLDEDGNIVSYTEATDEYADDSTNIATDDEGNTVYTYDDGSTVTIDADGNVVASTDPTEDDYTGGESEDVALEEGATDEELAEAGYYEDEYGNIYDGSGELVYAADDYWTDEEIADYIYTDDYGNQYDYYGNLVAEADHSDYVYTDDDGYQYDWDGNVIFDPYASLDDEYYEEEIPEDEVYAEEDYDYSDPDYFGKRGGLVALMKNGGGIRHFEDGGYSDTDEEVQDWQNVAYNYGEYDDPGLMTGDMSLNVGNYPNNTYENSDFGVVDTEVFDDGSYIEYMNDGSYIVYDSDGEVYQANANGVENSAAEAVIDRLTDESSSGTGASGFPVDDSRYSAGNIQYFDDGSYIQTFDDGSTLTVDSDGNVVGSTEAPDYSVTGAGSGGGRTQYYNTGAETPAQRARRLAEEAQQNADQKSAIDKVLEGITGSGYLGAGAAGAVLGALLGNSDLFSGGTGTQNQGIDMSKVGVIPARTTDFGVGPANYVTYDQYAAREDMPDIYGDELYRNLNAPGFNPVNEGDYGYEEEEEEEKTPAMADGGMVDTYYTFGKSVDPLQNLTNPRPAAQAPQMGGLQAQMPRMQTPNAMKPQQTQMPPAMKSGGLPALSNVPLAEGRLDFRKGSAVHGPGDGQSDDIPAMLADGEYVIDAETVAQIGNGSTKAGAKALDEFRMNIRKHKRSAPLDKIPPKTKALTSYLKKGN